VADEAQVKLLKEQGVKAWNEWRKANPGIRPDFRRVVLNDISLSTVDLREADFRSAMLEEADFEGADLSMADLYWSNLHKANLSNADINSANLSGAILIGADLTNTKLCKANLTGAHLGAADLFNVNVNEVDFTNSTMGWTQVGNINLNNCKGLDTVKHIGPSSIGIDTIYRSGGNIPEVFLRGAGVPEDFITFMKSLVGKPIEFYSCFISYSSRDQEFAERLHADLQRKNVRCWFAPEDLKIGDRLRPSFDEAIRVHDKLMVLLSENSVSSPWVEKEVETAFEKERREKRTVLFPIRLDDAVMETNEAWAADIRRTRHIGDFKDWKNHDSYKKAFERLLRDLKA
jgi:uncharacterized protein YjbI with pentapeptide repeats